MKTVLEWVTWGHGHPAVGTHSIVEWVLVGLAAATVVYAFYKAVRHVLYPGETSKDHIKWRILDDEENAG